jgi:hypothetical protein
MAPHLKHVRRPPLPSSRLRSCRDLNATCGWNGAGPKTPHRRRSRSQPLTDRCAPPSGTTGQREHCVNSHMELTMAPRPSRRSTRPRAPGTSPATSPRPTLRRLPARAEEGRDALRPPQAHPEARTAAPARSLRRRGEFYLAATAQNLRKLAKLIPATTPTMA